MRRLLFLFMICLLSLQWSWAAAASVCGHEAGGSHFGHHEHKHSAAAGDVDADRDATSQQSHPDCQVCHGFGVAFLTDVCAAPGAWDSRASLPEYAGALPEPPIDSLLRPPLTLVA